MLRTFRRASMEHAHFHLFFISVVRPHFSMPHTSRMECGARRKRLACVLGYKMKNDGSLLTPLSTNLSPLLVSFFLYTLSSAFPCHPRSFSPTSRPQSFPSPLSLHSTFLDQLTTHPHHYIFQRQSPHYTILHSSPLYLSLPPPFLKNTS